MKPIQTCILFLLSLCLLSAKAQQERTIKIQKNKSNITSNHLKNLQTGKLNDFENEISISIPFILSHSEAAFYTLGSPEYRSGKDLNYGIALNYSKVIYHGLFATIGLGCFKQQFSIRRPFYYVTPDNTKPLVSTKYYTYYTIYWIAGVGYKKKVSKNLTAKGIISYNNFTSYRQRYAQDYFSGINEVYKKSLPIGYMIDLDAGIEKNITKRISAGVNIILPLQTQWNNDKMFINNFYSAKEQQIARNKSSIGASVSCNYHF